MTAAFPVSIKYICKEVDGFGKAIKFSKADGVRREA